MMLRAAAANRDNNYNAANKAAAQAAASAAAANQWARNNDANRFAKDQVLAQNNAWRQGRRKNDDANYAYDKKFDLRDSVNGGFEYGESDNAHALDDFRDRAASYDRNADAAAARAAAADNQWASRQAAARQNAAAADANKDKFARNQNNAAAANARDRAWAQKLDASQGGNRLWSDARRKASDVYNDLLNADSAYGRAGKGFGQKGAAGYGGPGPYAYGVAGVGGYAAVPGYYGGGYGGDYAKAAGIKDLGRASQNAAASKLRGGDLAASSDVTKTQYRRDNNLDDKTKGFDRNNAAHANDVGFSDWARNNARVASAADAKNADAAAKSARDQAASNFNEDLWKKDAERKRLSDRNKKRKVYNKYFQNKNRGGDNWERLNFNRDDTDDVFGYDANKKQDWAQAAKDSRWNAAYDANKRQQQAANAADAAQRANNADWRKTNKGFQNVNANAQANAAASQNGRQNGAWKYDRGNAAADARLQNVNGWDRNSGRQGARLGGFNAGYAGLGAARAPVFGGFPAGGIGYGAGFGTLGAYGGGLGGGYGYKGGYKG
nr:hypothetical protein BaRGS_013311 [Batillaria attramentaria]